MMTSISAEMVTVMSFCSNSSRALLCVMRSRRDLTVSRVGSSVPTAFGLNQCYIEYIINEILEYFDIYTSRVLKGSGMYLQIYIHYRYWSPIPSGDKDHHTPFL